MENFYQQDSLIMAPLSGFTDLPYRRAARKCGCVYAFTEMIDIASLVYSHPRSFKMLERGDDETFLGVQLVGADAEHLKKAVNMVNDYDIDVLDFNLGCPVPKVAKKGAGAELGRNIKKAVELFDIMRNESKFPVTAKIRILSESESNSTLDLAGGLAEKGAAAITIHGRIKERFYAGEVFAETIKTVRENIPVQIIANGGVMGLGSYNDLRTRSGCDCVMLARGAMGNPWLFQEIMNKESYVPPDLSQWRLMMEEHITGIVECYGEESGMKIARKIILDYLRGRGFVGTFRSEASTLCTLKEFFDFTRRTAENHTDGYWQWLEHNPQGERRLRK